MIRHMLRRLLLMAGALLCFTPLAATAVPYYHYSYTGKPYPNDPAVTPGYEGHFITADIFTFLPLLENGLINQANTPALRLYMNDGVNALRWPDYSGPINNSLSVSVNASIYIDYLMPDGLPAGWVISITKSLFETSTGHSLGGIRELAGASGSGYDASFHGDPPFFSDFDGASFEPGTWQLTISDAPLPAPEPSIFLLLGAGLLVLAVKPGLIRGSITQQAEAALPS